MCAFGADSIFHDHLKNKCCMEGYLSSSRIKTKRQQHGILTFIAKIQVVRLHSFYSVEIILPMDLYAPEKFFHHTKSTIKVFSSFVICPNFQLSKIYLIVIIFYLFHLAKCFLSSLITK